MSLLLMCFSFTISFKQIHLLQSQGKMGLEGKKVCKSKTLLSPFHNPQKCHPPNQEKYQQTLWFSSSLNMDYNMYHPSPDQEQHQQKQWRRPLRGAALRRSRRRRSSRVWWGLPSLSSLLSSSSPSSSSSSSLSLSSSSLSFSSSSSCQSW